MTQNFSQRVYDLALNIPAGRVTTYGALAKAALGGAMAARSVSGILGKAPNQKAIPWHRIVYAGGKIWLPTNPKECAQRLRLYQREGIVVNKKTGRIVNFEDILYDFNEA